MTSPEALAHTEWDVVVIGAGPAGAMTATLAARRGLRTLLIDRARFPRDKVCGCCLAPLGRRVLEAAGLDGAVGGDDAVRLDRLRLRRGRRAADIQIPAYVGVGRAALDAALVDAARAEGATVLHGVRAVIDGHGCSASLTPVDRAAPDRASLGRAASTAVRAAVFVLADGVGGSAGSGVPGMTWRVRASSHVGLGVVVDHAPAGIAADRNIQPHSVSRSVSGSGSRPGSRRASGAITMCVGRGGYVGIAPIGGGRWSVAAAIAPRLIRAHGPAEAARSIAGGCGVELEERAVRGLSGTAALTRRREALEFGGRVFAVGDSAGYVEPFTGEGMSWALAGATELAPVVEDAVMRRYRDGWWTDVHRRRIAPGKRACRAVCAGLRSPAAVSVAVRTVGAAPRLGRAIAALVSGAASVRGLHAGAPA